jgi:branched-chain amino acid aminotransferase
MTRSDDSPKSAMMEWAYFEGEIVPFSEAKISVGTHVVQYGTGVFAGIRAYLSADGETLNVFRLRDHAQRLLNSARLLRAETAHTVDSVAQIIVDLLEKNAPEGDTYIRPFFYKPAVQLTPRLRGIGDELAVYMLPLGDYLPTSGVKAIVSSWVRVPDNAIPSRGKITGSYINSAFAKDEAPQYRRQGGGRERLQSLHRPQRYPDHRADLGRHPGRDYPPHRGAARHRPRTTAGNARHRPL